MTVCTTLPAQKPEDPSPQQKLAALEQKAPASGVNRFYALERLARAAFAAGDYNKSEAYAMELLAMAPEYRQDWNYGNAIYYGSMWMGRVALARDHNISGARNALLAAGRTTGSPQLNSFGPNMTLAKDLLDLGERDTVLAFFVLCRDFWKRGKALDEWTAAIQDGRAPNFGANLLY